MGKHNNKQPNNINTTTKQDDLVIMLEILEDLKILEKPENLETLLVMIDDVKSGKRPYSETELREVSTATLLRVLDEDSTKIRDLSELAHKLDDDVRPPQLRNRVAPNRPTTMVEKLVVVKQKLGKWVEEVRLPHLENHAAHHTPAETVEKPILFKPELEKPDEDVHLPRLANRAAHHAPKTIVEKPVTVKKKPDVSVPQNPKKYLWAVTIMSVTATVLTLSSIAAVPILPIAPLAMMILGAFLLGSALVSAAFTVMFLVNAVSEKRISMNSVQHDNPYRGVPFIQMQDILNNSDIDLENYAWQPQGRLDNQTMETVPTTLATNAPPVRSWR